VRVTLSASTFVPKPFTPFQWFGMDGVDAFRAKQSRIRRQAPKGVEFKHHDHESSWLEGVLSRADRSLAPAILEAFRRGAVLDSWSEHLDVERWRSVFADLGIDAEAWATRPIPLEAELPWEVIDPLVRRRWLEAEYRKSLEAATMATCADACSGCAPFSKECVRGEVAERRWDDLDVRTTVRIPAFPVERAPAGRNGEAPTAAPRERPHVAPVGDARAPVPADAPVEAAALPADAPPAAEPPLYRWRARFEKTGRSRFMGHLDLVRALTMALRRAGIQVAYSQGFKPHPRVSLSPALSLGVSSRGEYIDFDTHAPLDGETFLLRINQALPEGIRFSAVVPADLAAPSLQEAITRAIYRAVVPGATRDQLAAGAEAFLARSAFEVVRSRKGKPDKVLDLRPMIEDLGLDGEGRLLFTLVLDPNGSPRLPEVLAAVAGPGCDAGAEIERVGLYAREGGKLLSPLVVGRRPRATMA
jgi:radical SAM-linked protein